MMTDDERLREMAQQQLAQAASHQVLGRVKKVQYHRRRAGLFRSAAHAIRVNGMLVEALESVVTLMVDCPRDGATAPVGECDCDTCATFREVGAALTEARKAP
jgi:hypothetical protein